MYYYIKRGAKYILGFFATKRKINYQYSKEKAKALEE